MSQQSRRTLGIDDVRLSKELKTRVIKMLRKNNFQKATRLRSLVTKSWMLRLLLLMSIPVAGAGTQPVRAQTSTLQGTVTVSSTSGPGQILPGTTLNLTSSGSSQKTHSTVTNDQGEFK